MPQMTVFTPIAVVPALSLLLVGGAASAATMGSKFTAVALAQGGGTLVTLDTGLGLPSAVAITSAGTAVTIDDIDFRPSTGELYGYSNASGTVYTIDRKTGEANAVASASGLTSTNRAGFDFNNVLDAARIVTSEGENVVFFPNNTPPNLSRFTDLFYVEGDANEGAVPQVRMNAYTNAVAGPTMTQQFVLDTGLDVLAMLGNNAGTLTTVGELFLDGARVDFGDMGGFDILSMAEGDNTALALLTTGDTQAIYTLPLFADAEGRINLTFQSAVTGEYGMLNGFAVQAPAPVPVPAAFGLMAVALSAIGALRLRRRG